MCQAQSIRTDVFEGSGKEHMMDDGTNHFAWRCVEEMSIKVAVKVTSISAMNIAAGESWEEISDSRE